VLVTFAYCKSCCRLQRTTDIELEKQGESENIIIFFHKHDCNSHADFAWMRRAIEKAAILAAVDNKTAKTTHSMCVAATVSVSLLAVCSWIATCNCRTSRSSKSTRINSPTSSLTTPVFRSKPGVTDCDAEKRRSPVLARGAAVFEHRGIASAVTADRVWSVLIAFHRPGARGGAEVQW